MHGLLENTIILARNYNQQFQETIFKMLFDFQGECKWLEQCYSSDYHFII